MASKEEEKIHQMWMKGYNTLFKARNHGTGVVNYFIAFRENGLDDETIAMALNVPVEDVDHDIRIYQKGMAQMAESNKLADLWIEKNGTSPLLEGYDES